MRSIYKKRTTTKRNTFIYSFSLGGHNDLPTKGLLHGLLDCLSSSTVLRLAVSVRNQSSTNVGDYDITREKFVCLMTDLN